MDAGSGEKLIGRITHYFSRLSVCSIELTDGELKVGDTIHISGKHTDFIQTVGSMQIEHQNINKAEKGKVVGVKVKEKVRQHDQVILNITPFKEGKTMADEIQRVQYFYTEVPDKPGEGARVLNALKGEGVNLLAYAAFPKGRRAQIDFIPTDQAAFKAAAKKAKIKLVGPKTGFVIQGDDRPGAVAEIVSKLSEAKINITALHAVAAGAGRYGAILWVKSRDVNKAAKILLQEQGGT